MDRNLNTTFKVGALTPDQYGRKDVSTGDNASMNNQTTRDLNPDQW
jgi:hypothetical protein